MGLIARLEKETDPPGRRRFLSALARLYSTEGTWKGNSWGTRPDSTGPYYQPAAWSESPKIAAALKRALEGASGDEPTWLLAELHRNRVHLDDALERLLTLASTDRAFVPATVAQLKWLPRPPDAALPLLKAAASGDQTDLATRADAAVVLLRADDAEAFATVLATIEPLQKDSLLAQLQQFREAFMQPESVTPHLDAVESAGQEADRSGVDLGGSRATVGGQPRRHLARDAGRSDPVARSRLERSAASRSNLAGGDADQRPQL